MRLLIDAALAPSIAARLREAGFDALHVRELGLQRAPDTEILDVAEREGRTVVSADTDFGTLLALRSKRSPSFVLLRRQKDTTPAKTAELLIELLPRISTELGAGSVVVVTDDRLRIRSLPVRPDDR